MNNINEPRSLYPEPEPLSVKGPGLREQLLGVFTAPVPLFRRLAASPRWGAALITLMALTLVMVVIWAARVDADALLRPALMRDPAVAPEQINRTIEVWGRLLGVFCALGVLVGMPVATLFVALIFWLVGRGLPGPGGPPDYQRALSAVAVPGLVALPRLILVSVLCLARPVRGFAPDAISPLSLGFLFTTGHGRLDAVLRGFDLFAAANLVLLFLAARHILGMKTSGALVCAVAWTALAVGCLLLSPA